MQHDSDPGCHCLSTTISACLLSRTCAILGPGMCPTEPHAVQHLVLVLTLTRVDHHSSREMTITLPTERSGLCTALARLVERLSGPADDKCIRQPQV